MATSGFEYMPLKGHRDFRVISLQQGNAGDDIHCFMENVVLDDCPHFEAISYAWGDANDTRLIYINNCSTSVTVSLYSALRGLRWPHRTRTVWADAICINQQSNEEKNTQVQLMAKIYSLAKRVLIWLGDDTSGIEGVAKTIANAFQLFPDGIPNSKNLDEYLRIKLLKACSLSWANLPYSFDFDWKPLAKLLEKPWFVRKWVIQEVVLARQAVICCGNIILPFERICELAYILLTTDDMHYVSRLMDVSYSEVLRHCAIIYMYRHKNGDALRYSLLDLVNSSRYFKCSDQRDHIFSLLGLSELLSSDKMIPTPDYISKPADVFKAFTTWNIMQNGSLVVLSVESEKEPSQEPSLPSWVPNFARLGDPNALARDTYGVFKANTNNSPAVSLSTCGNILNCQGTIVDCIKDMAPDYSSVPSYPGGIPKSAKLRAGAIGWNNAMKEWQWLTHCMGLASDCHDSYDGSKMSRARYAQFWRTLFCDMGGFQTRADEQTAKAFHSYFNFLSDLIHGGRRAWNQEDQLCKSRVIQTFELFAYHRSFSTTTGGRLAQVPKRSQIGDKICVLLGAQVPHVIRPIGNGRYILVGECYLNGMMDGEVSGIGSSDMIVLE